MKVVAFLPAKGSSSRIENKNIKLIDGKPLFLHTLEKLVASELFDDVYLDTESKEIIDLASEVNCKILLRDPAFSSNKTDGNKLLLNEINSVEADIYVQILCTSPFISIKTIKDGIDAVVSGRYDSALLIKKEKQYRWGDSGPEYDLDKIPNSIDLEDSVIETMGLYIIKKEVALATGRRIGLTPYLLEATPIEAIDVNWPEEFELANLIAAGIRENDRKLLDNIKNQMSSCLLSDLLDDFGYPNQVIKGLTPNFKQAKILGRAKTLKLRELKQDEDFKGIYNALNTYETIIPNDIIIVENEVGEYAYFGELNANLAIRSGASGVIISGKTRDRLGVEKTGLPVFSRGYSCQDVRKRATVEHYNKKIFLDGISVEPECLVFADLEGVVIIPKKIERDVIKEVYKRTKNENDVLLAIANGESIKDLVDKCGFF